LFAKVVAIIRYESFDLIESVQEFFGGDLMIATFDEP
jgi:hypothetical protein